MADKSSIEWTDSSWQPISGCSRVSEGCKHCYAERMAGTRLRHQPKYEGLTRLTSQGPRWTGITRLNEQDLLIPLRWRKPRRIFVCSMADLFHESVPFEWLDKVFAVMALCPQHTFQVLTKRPERMAEYLHECDKPAVMGPYYTEAEHVFGDRISDHIAQHVGIAPWKLRTMWPLPNVWLGCSCEDQATADERIPNLIRCPAAVRFLSCEPLLAEINLEAVMCDHDLDEGKRFWVIVGGESGRSARPCVIGHIRSLVQQCQAAGVAVFVKQLGSNPVNREGERHPITDHHDIEQFPADLRVRQWPEPSIEKVMA